MISALRQFWLGLCDVPLIPTIKPSDYARRKRVLSRGQAFKPGKFEPYPMQVDPLDDLIKADVSEVVLCWAAQTGGKNEVINTAISYFIEEDPSPQLLVMPTEKLAGEYSKERIAPMIRDQPGLKARVRDPRSRDSGNTVLSKTFPGGSLALVGANAPSGLAGRPRRVVLQDEIDRYPVSAGTEGDPCALADKRAEAFPNAVKLKTSTPTVKGKSRIWTLLEQSDFQKWHARCPRCQAEQVFAWSQVGWLDGAPETAWIECAACKGKLNDGERVAAVRAGRWKATRRFTGIRGFWLNGINTLLPKHKGFKTRLHEMAAEFLKAKAGGPETLRVWVNTFLAECFEEETEAPASTGDLLKRREDYAPDLLPIETLVLTAGVDVQEFRLEAFVWGFGVDDESWSVERKVFDGDPDKNEVWNALDNYLLQTFTRTDGVPLKIQRAFVDMQYKSRRVLSFCRPRISRGLFPCRGVNREGPVVPPLLPAEPSRNNRARIPHWNVGVTVAKTTIFDRLKLPTPGPRSMHFPEGAGHDEDFFRQLTAEKRKTRHTHGVAYFIFEKDNSGVRNEVLDLHVYALAALESLGPIGWEAVAKNLLKTRPKKPETDPAAAEAPAETQAPRAPRKNFANNW